MTFKLLTKTDLVLHILYIESLLLSSSESMLLIVIQLQAFLELKPLVQTPCQTVSLKLHKEQTLFSYFLLRFLDRSDPCYPVN